MSELAGNTNNGEPIALREPFPSSNTINLTGWNWLVVGIFAVLLIVLTPYCWQRVEPIHVEPDFRMPFELSNDYWLYERYARLAVAEYDEIVIGDSVVWGPYVTRHGTLSHYLNVEAGRERFVNLGLNGTYPAALAGLLEYYGGSISGKNVILQCNPLWMSSRVQDLQELPANDDPIIHSRLLPQCTDFPWYADIPRYKADVTDRLGIAIDRHVPFTGWTGHLQQVYFRDSSDPEESSIPKWTLRHPYDNPARQVTFTLPPPDDKPREEPIPWFKRGRKPDDFSWVELDTSIQWRSFRRAVSILQERHNQVFVLVGPFNEHMVKEPSLQKYRAIKQGIEAWLKEQNIPYAMPTALPRDYYGDLSHPLAAGYEMLARELNQEQFFQR